MKYTVYSKPDCIWCDRAKKLLTRLGLQYDEKVLGVDYTKDQLKELIAPVIVLTVPQIFHDGEYIGGYEDLVDYLDNSLTVWDLEF